MLLGLWQVLPPLALPLAPHGTGNWSHWFPMPNEPEGASLQRVPTCSARIVANSSSRASFSRRAASLSLIW